MAAPVDLTSLLSRLQTEVNRVLEQTGRVFAAAASKDPKSDPTAQAIKLKHVLSDSSNRFHDALDQLEDELHIARLVLRRDLALLTAQDGTEGVQRRSSAIKHEADVVKQDAVVQDHVQIKSDPDGDVAMVDLEPSQISAQSEPGDAKSDDVPRALPGAADEDLSQTLLSNSDDTKTLSVGTDDAKATQEVLSLPAQGDTSVDEHAGDTNDIPPETATSNAVDLESLFGSTSATAGPDGNEFNANPNDDNVFDFSIDADEPADNANSSIESFLPGLQDYANTQPDEVVAVDDTDLDALFSGFAVPPAQKNEQAEQEGQGERDTTFDDLLDFADLGASQFAGSGQSGEGGTDFDFDFT